MKLPNITLRDLFWLVLAVAVGLAWSLDRTARRSQLIDAEQDVAKRLSFCITDAWFKQAVANWSQQEWERGGVYAVQKMAEANSSVEDGAHK
jgi:hypothetical protein